MARTRFRRKRYQDPRWDHCRGVTNRVIDIAVDVAHPKWGPIRRRAWRVAMVSSRKRWNPFGNPGSDHHRSQKNADAVDFRFWRHNVRYGRMNKIMERLGVPVEINDYQHYTIEHNGRLFRVQPIAAVHGTAPHLHIGVRRI